MDLGCKKYGIYASLTCVSICVPLSVIDVIQFSPIIITVIFWGFIITTVLFGVDRHCFHKVDSKEFVKRVSHGKYGFEEEHSSKALMECCKCGYTEIQNDYDFDEPYMDDEPEPIDEGAN